MSKYKTFLSLFLLYLIINMIIFPSLYINTCLDGITIWAISVLPSLLPFVIFTKLLSNLGFTEKISSIFQKPCKLLFNAPKESAFVYLSSIISGYPMGAKMIADLYQTGKITRKNAIQMSSFCSTSGPMFIVGVIGASMLDNVKFGYIIYFCHIIGALLNGLLYKNLKIHDKKVADTIIDSKPNDFSSIILDSSLSLISVGAIISVFFVIISSLSPLFNLLPDNLSGFFEGLIEITKGCKDISTSITNKWTIPLITSIVSFGGLSTIIQSLTFLSKAKITAKTIVLQKTTQAVISGLISLIVILFI